MCVRSRRTSLHDTHRILRDRSRMTALDLRIEMPAYVTNTLKVNTIDIIWSESSSDYDISGRWISIPNAQIGHIHFHINRRTQRGQAWVLEKKSWEEYYLNFYSPRDVSIEELVKRDPWVYFVLCARNFAAT